MEEKTFSETERHLRGGAPTGDDSSEVEEKPKKDWLKIIALSLVSIFLLSVTFYAGYWLGSQQSKVEAPEQTIPTPTQALIPTPTPTFTLDPTADWKTYKNEEYKFSFKYPVDLTVEEVPVPTSGYTQIIINKNEEDSFIIKASKNYLPADIIYFLDTASTGQINISGNAWKEYFLPKGYGNGPEGLSSPIYGLQFEKNAILYTITFSNQTSMNQGQERILSTLKFID